MLVIVEADVAKSLELVAETGAEGSGEWYVQQKKPHLDGAFWRLNKTLYPTTWGQCRESW